MNKLQNLPTDSSQWKLHFDALFKCIENAVSNVAFGRYKISVIMTNLNAFKNSFFKNKCGTMNRSESKILFNFFTACTGFIALCSQYTSEALLSYLLKNSINKQYEELHLIWQSWANQASSLLLSGFTYSTTFAYANYLDIKAIHDVIKPMISKMPAGLANALNYKMDDIELILRSPPEGKESSTLGIIEHSDFETVKQIGKGAYAIVNLAIMKSDKRKIAVKELKQVNLGRRNVLSLKRELDILLRLKHPNILGFVGVTVTPPFCIATTYIGNGSLFDNLHGKNESGNKLTPLDKLKIALGMAHGLEYLASMKYVHRDFKSQNVLLDNDKNAIICDFGISRMLGPRMTSELGTVQWTAPEVLLSTTKVYDTSCDTYSYGMVLWELLCDDLPHKELRPAQIAALVIEKHLRPPIKEGSPKEMVDLIQKCWAQDPKERPKMKKVIELLESGNLVFDKNTNIEEFKKWANKTKEEHEKIMKESNKLASIEKESIFEKLHKLNPLDPAAPTVLQELYQINFSLTKEIIIDILKLINQVYSIQVQEIAFDLFKVILSKDDLLKNISLDDLIVLLEPQLVQKPQLLQPQYEVAIFKIIAEKIDDVEPIIQKFLSIPQTHVTIEIIQTIISPNTNKINEKNVLSIFEKIDEQYSVSFFRFIINEFGAKNEFLPIACRSPSFLSLFMKQMAKLCDDNPEEVKNNLNIDEIKMEGRSALQQHLDLISVALVSRTCDVNEKMGIILYKYLIANCLKFQCYDTVLHLLCITSRAASLRPILSQHNIWKIIMDGIEEENNIDNSLYLIERIPFCDDEEMKNDLWNRLLSKYFDTKSENVAHAISSLIKRYKNFEFDKLIEFILNGYSSSDNSYVLSSLKIARAFSGEILKTIYLKENFWNSIKQKINEKNNNICKSISKLVIKMIRSIPEFVPNIEFCNSSLKLLYDESTIFATASNFIVFFIEIAKEKKYLVYLQKRYFMQYLEQLPFRYEGEDDVNDIIDFSVLTLTKYYPAI